MTNVQEAEFDVYCGTTPIGGACAIQLHDRAHLLTAFHISHIQKDEKTPRALTFRSRRGNISLHNISFRKVRRSCDLSLSEPVELTVALPVASQFVSNDRYTTLGSPMSILPERFPTIPISATTPISMREAPQFIHRSSTKQPISFGYSGKPLKNRDGEVVAIIIGWAGSWGDTNQCSAETLRQQIFR